MLPPYGTRDVGSLTCSDEALLDTGPGRVIRYPLSAYRYPRCDGPPINRNRSHRDSESISPTVIRISTIT